MSERRRRGIFIATRPRIASSPVGAAPDGGSRKRMPPLWGLVSFLPNAAIEGQRPDSIPALGTAQGLDRQSGKGSKPGTKSPANLAGDGTVFQPSSRLYVLCWADARSLLWPRLEWDRAFGPQPRCSGLLEHRAIKMARRWRWEWSGNCSGVAGGGGKVGRALASKTEMPLKRAAASHGERTRPLAVPCAPRGTRRTCIGDPHCLWCPGVFRGAWNIMPVRFVDKARAEEAMGRLANGISENSPAL